MAAGVFEYTEHALQLMENGYMSQTDFLTLACSPHPTPTDSDTDCAVCWGSLDPSLVTGTTTEMIPIGNSKCQHVFHFGCLKQVFEANLAEDRPSMMCPYRCCKWYDADSEIENAKVMEFAITNIQNGYYTRPIDNRHVVINLSDIVIAVWLVAYASRLSGSPFCVEANSERGRRITASRADFWLDELEFRPMSRFHFTPILDEYCTNFRIWLDINIMNVYLDMQEGFMVAGRGRRL